MLGKEGENPISITGNRNLKFLVTGWFLHQSIVYTPMTVRFQFRS